MYTYMHMFKCNVYVVYVYVYVYVCGNGYGYGYSCVYSVVFIPTEIRINMKVSGRIPKLMAVWVSIRFLSVQQTLTMFTREKG